MYEYGKDEETTYYVFPTYQTIDDAKQGIANVFMAAPLRQIWYRVEKQS